MCPVSVVGDSLRENRKLCRAAALHSAQKGHRGSSLHAPKALEGRADVNAAGRAVRGLGWFPCRSFHPQTDALGRYSGAGIGFAARVDTWIPWVRRLARNAALGRYLARIATEGRDACSGWGASHEWRQGEKHGWTSTPGDPRERPPRGGNQGQVQAAASQGTKARRRVGFLSSTPPRSGVPRRKWTGRDPFRTGG